VATLEGNLLATHKISGKLLWSVALESLVHGVYLARMNDLDRLYTCVAAALLPTSPAVP
jgi:hypothetical protein